MRCFFTKDYKERTKNIEFLALDLKCHNFIIDSLLFHRKSFSPRLPGGGSLDRFLCPQTPVIRARVSQPAVVNERPIVDVEFSLKTLNSKRFAAPVKPHHTWVCVGQVADRSGWICSREDQLYAVNFQRLYEVVLFSRMLSQHHLPTQKALNPLTISHKYVFVPLQT